MNTYLVIITTVLVLTQVIRVVQNAIQLSRFKKRNEEVAEAYVKIAEDVSDIYKFLTTRLD